MRTITSWENIPSEIWLMILGKLPIKSQVSLGCTCKKMYRLSLDLFLNNREKRMWIYLEDNIYLPVLLAKAITILRIPAPRLYNPGCYEKPSIRRQKSLFLKGEIQRMSNLQKLIIEKDARRNECMLYFSDLNEIVLKQNLDELKVPKDFLISKYPSGEKLLHLAVKKGNVKLVDSLLSQMQVHFQLHKLSDEPDFLVEINARDEQGNTPLKIAVEKGNKELILLLFKKGARGKEYLLSRENPDLSSFRQDTIDKGSHLQIDYLDPRDFSAFFEAVANSSSILSLGFSVEGYREIKRTGLDFFQGLAGALQSNFQRCTMLSQADLEDTAKGLRLLILDLRDCEELTGQEIKPLFTCLGLEELWLPASVVDHLDEQQQNLLHLLVQESPMNKKIAGSLITQGVALSSRDHKGRTPVELARERGLMPGALEMANFLEQAAKKKLTTIAFGKKDWEKYFGKVSKEPPLPITILEVLESSCPIWSGKKVQGTHFLTLIPEKVDGKPLTLNSLQDLVENPKGGGNKTEYRHYWDAIKNEHGSKPSGSSYWVLMTKDILPNTRKKPYYQQLAELNMLAARASQIKGLGEYKTPKTLEAATSILMEYVRSGTRLYDDGLQGEPPTYTRCEETVTVDKTQYRVTVGCFAASGLGVFADLWDDVHYGLGALRKCLDFLVL